MLVTQNRTTQPLVSAVRMADLRAALDALPVPFRQAVWLRDVEEHSYAEIAQLEAIPMATVMSRISRGRRLLFARLTEDTTRGDRWQLVHSKEADMSAQNIKNGVYGGLAGGAVFGVMMGMMGMLPMIGQMVGAPSALVGFVVHMPNSAIIGAAFAVVFGGRVTGTGSGVGYGFGVVPPAVDLLVSERRLDI